MKDLLERELIVVAGKGGVGKTTIAGAIGALSAGGGRSTAVVEMTGSGSLAGLLADGKPSYDGREVRPGLHIYSISASKAVEEYILRHIRFRKLYDLVFGNRFIAPFMNAVLGLNDLISLGKVMDLGWEVDRDGKRRFDLLVLDSPATGHGLTMLHSPRAMMELARKGPLHNNAQLVDELLSDPARAALILVTLPEETPVNETIEMAARLVEHGGIQVSAVVINGVPISPLSAAEEDAYRHFVSTTDSRAGGEVGRALREVGRMIARRDRAQGQIDRLRRSLDVPTIEVPMLHSRTLGEEQLATVVRCLEELP